MSIMSPDEPEGSDMPHIPTTFAEIIDMERDALYKGVRPMGQPPGSVRRVSETGPENEAKPVNPSRRARFIGWAAGQLRDVEQGGDVRSNPSPFK